MRGISAVGAAGGQSAATVRPDDRTTLAISKALEAKRQEAGAVLRLIEQAGRSGKGGHIDYWA